MTIKVNRSGLCPYCPDSDFDEAKTETVIPNQKTLMFCKSCLKWSMRAVQKLYQYPLLDPSDKGSPPTTVGPDTS